jgi:predicted nucleic acid-binding protein
VDATVLSEPTKPAPDARVVDWLRRHERNLAVNPIILGELEYGILILPASRRRTRLEQWFTAGVQPSMCSTLTPLPRPPGHASSHG